MKEIFKDTGIVLIVCLLFSVFVIIFTPYPVSSIIHQFFTTSSPAKEPANYSSIQEKIVIKKELEYPSLAGANTYDLILPKEGKKLPVIIWVHGGAYVGGQKEDSRIYSEMLASEGYAVANMEYELAPTASYPLPIIQIGDLYKELAGNAQKYSLDMNSVIFAGDSAGGQIVSQFVNLQVNENYRKKMSFESVVPEESIKGTMLYCVPFSIEELSQDSGSFIQNFFIKRIGWSYVKDANWKNSSLLEDGELKEVVQEKFPPTFIADGNTYSFEKQGKEFAQHLKGEKIKVETAFYPEKEGKLMHEYQFDMTLPQAQDTYKKTISFLRGLDY